MTAPDERTLELIHAELDGELAGATQIELDQRLEADPQARALRDQLGRMAGSLGRMESVVPPELHLQLLQATRPRARIISSRERRAQIARYGLALAAGMVFAVVGLTLTERSRSSFDPRELAGTMGREAAHPLAAVASRQLQGNQLSGSVALSPAEGHWLLVFDLSSRAPVAVSATYEDAAFRLNGYAQGDAGVSSFSASPGRVGFVNQGEQRLALFLEPGSGGPVKLRFESAGRLLDQAVLQVPGKGRLH